MVKNQDQLSSNRTTSDINIHNQTLGLERIREIIRRLTNEIDGCPWDQIQTNKSLAKHTIEEAYELADSIETQSSDEIRKELGDLLFNVLFHIHIASEANMFTLDDVINDNVQKMVSRHPHVFHNKETKTVQEVSDQWEEIKRNENRINQSGRIKQELKNLAKNLPAMTQSDKIQKKVASVGFDWENSYEIINKIYEEIDEFIDQQENENKSGMLDELGDILFSVVNLTRFVGIDPETALRSTNRKFVQRIIRMEQFLNKTGKEIQATDKKELNLIWQKIKRGQ